MTRPIQTTGTTKRIRCGCGWIYVTHAEAESYQEVFLRLGKSGGCPAAFLDGVGRLVTFALNAGVPRETIVRAFGGIRCPSPIHTEGIEVLSCLDAVAKMLKDDGTLA